MDHARCQHTSTYQQILCACHNFRTTEHSCPHARSRFVAQGHGIQQLHLTHTSPAPATRKDARPIATPPHTRHTKPTHSTRTSPQACHENNPLSRHLNWPSSPRVPCETHVHPRSGPTSSMIPYACQAKRPRPIHHSVRVFTLRNNNSWLRIREEKKRREKKSDCLFPEKKVTLE